MDGNRCLLLLLLVSVFYGTSWGANILYMSTTPSPSHHIWDKTLAMGLREKGHTITFVTHSVEKNLDNFTVIYLEGMYEKLQQEYNWVEMVDSGVLQITKELFEWISTVCEHDVETQGVQNLIKLAKSGVKFDVVLYDMTTGQCLYPILEMLGNPPVIATSPLGVAAGFNSGPFGADLHSSHIPLFLFKYTDQMTFFQRMANHLMTLYFMYLREYVHMPAYMEVSKKLFGNEIQNFHDVERNFSLLLANYDHVLDFPQSLPPAVIPVGGLHTKRTKTLPQDLQKILDNSKDGVILFSLGTNLRSDQLGPKERNAILGAFAKLKQTVLWKFESNIDNLPKNVIVRKFLPQNDILAHPNLKLFISHGGGLSTKEAMMHGVPIVGIPFFGDQPTNVHKMMDRKLALKVEYREISEEVLLKAINEILNNPIYKQNALLVSKRFNDQLQNPLERAVFWVEYVVRQGGAQHLSIAGKNMSFFQKECLDIWAAILGVILGFYLIVCRLCCRKKKAYKSQKKIKTN